MAPRGGDVEIRCAVDDCNWTGKRMDAVQDHRSCVHGIYYEESHRRQPARIARRNKNVNLGEATTQRAALNRAKDQVEYLVEEIACLPNTFDEAGEVEGRNFDDEVHDLPMGDDTTQMPDGTWNGNQLAELIISDRMDLEDHRWEVKIQELEEQLRQIVERLRQQSGEEEEEAEQEAGVTAE